jgi:hypothetical protein
MTAETAAVQSASDASAVKLFCPKCNILQPEGARQRSYYDVFNMSVWQMEERQARECILVHTSYGD